MEDIRGVRLRKFNLRKIVLGVRMHFHHTTSQPSYLIENHCSLIQICITTSLESTPWFIPSASPVTSRLTSSFTCQLISVIATTLIIHHSFTPGSKPIF